MRLEMEFEPLCFPTLKDRAPAGAHSANDSDGEFQPLYQCASYHGTESDPKGDNDTRLMADARQRGYQNGRSAGEEEACRQARAAVAPGLERFLLGFEHLADHFRHSAETAGVQIVGLALKMVERILGPDLDITGRDLSPLSPMLEEAITQSLRLKIQINSEDLELLQAIANDHSLQWPAPTKETVLEGQASLDRGSFNITLPSVTADQLTTQASDSLAEILAVSTK